MEVVHEGRGGYVRVAIGASSFDYPMDHVADGKFEVHFPAGNRSSQRHAHRVALESLCRREPTRFRLRFRD